MAEEVGELLQVLENTQMAKYYRSTIRKMQPADLVRRLESEKVSTRGHMPELRGRLLRLEARKLGLKVPWYAEDDDTAVRVQQDYARVQSAKVSKLKKTILTKNEALPTKKTRRKETNERNRSDINEARGYTERVLKGAADALHKMINTITDKDFFDSMARIRSAERRPKTKNYGRLPDKN